MALGQAASTFRQMTTTATLHARNGLTMMGWTRHHSLGGFNVFWGCKNANGGTQVYGNLGLRTPMMTAGGTAADPPIGISLVTDSYEALSAEVYHHLAFTISGGANVAGNFMIGYFDGGQGAKQRSDFFNFETDVIPTDFFVGSDSTAVSAYHQHIRAWNRVLTAGEIRREMWSRFPINRQKLIIDLPLVENGHVLDRAQQNVWAVSNGPMDFEVGPILGGPWIPSLNLAAGLQTPVRKWLLGAH